MTQRSPVSEHRDGSVIELFVQPRAARTELAGRQDDALRLRVTAPPVDGAANAEVLAFLAKQLRVPKSRLELVSGQTGRWKRVLVRGLDPDAVTARLGAGNAEPAPAPS